MQGKLVLSRVSLHMQEGWDPYDDSRFDNLRLSDLNTMPVGSVVVWDSEFGPVESRISSDELDRHPRLKFVRSFQASLKPNWPVFVLRIYEVTGPKK
jgi:hypothetical protein